MNQMRVVGMAAALLASAGCLVIAVRAPAVAAAGAHEPLITVSFPAASSEAPLDGRVILLLSRDLQREPRTHVEPNMPLDSPYLFGLTVDGLRPGVAAAVDSRAFGWPAARLSALPEGDYLVQAVLNRYETFNLADGRVLKLPGSGRGAALAGQAWQLVFEAGSGASGSGPSGEAGLELGPGNRPHRA